MTTTPKLTARQQQILDLIEQTIASTGAPPTRAEIATAFGFRSPNAAEDHLQALARKGVIQLVGGTSRGIRLQAAAMQSVHGLWQRAEADLTGLLSLPLIGRVAAGSPILAQEHVEQTYCVAPGLFEERPDYLLKVRGMSMRDIGILDGDLLAVRKTTEVRNGQIVVARIDGDVTVKRLQRKSDHIELLPENPEFRPIIVGPGEVFAIEGLAVGLVRHQFKG